MKLSEWHPWLYVLCVWVKRLVRCGVWVVGPSRYCRTVAREVLPHRVKKHSSLLLRRLGDSDIQLQRNKVVNLGIAIRKFSGMVIRPGETFSFCRAVGRPTRRKGYLEGMELSRGEARPGVGGGLCQLSNFIYWLVLHSPLIVTERHHHSFDPFPDDRRTLPFGSGATVFYNYLDLQFVNQTPFTFQLIFWLTDKCLEGELRAGNEIPYTYFVFEDKHSFVRVGDKLYRRNEIWRRVMERKGGKRVGQEFLTRNFCEVKYALPTVKT